VLESAAASELEMGIKRRIGIGIQENNRKILIGILYAWPIRHRMVMGG
jgi:hypothetical protein